MPTTPTRSIATRLGDSNNHIRSIVTNARHLTVTEGADLLVVMPAAWLHDCVAVPKSGAMVVNQMPHCVLSGVFKLASLKHPPTIRPGPVMSRNNRPNHTARSVRASCTMLRNP